MFPKINPDELRGQQQKEILEHDFSKEPLLVIGGPGAGKTYILISIIEKVLSGRHKESNLFVASFTNEAVGKLKKDIEDRIRVELKNVNTLHFRAKGILHKYSKKANLPASFRVLTELEEKSLLKDVKYDLYLFQGKKYSIHELAGLLKESKRARSALKESACPEFEEVLDSIKRFYQAIDWYDVVYLANKILLESPEIKESESNGFSFLLVDEYQDLNFAEQKFIQLINNERPYLMIVGDDDQSIYSWRFANPSGIFEFKKMYPFAKVIKLKVSSRCPNKILVAAHNLIKRNKREIRECLLAHSDVKKKAGEGLIESVRCESNNGEVLFLREAVSTLLEQGVKEEEILVLFSNKTIGSEYVDVLSSGEGGFRIDNRLKPASEPSLNDPMFSYLIKLSKNPQDNLALRIVLERLLKLKLEKILKCRSLATKTGTSLLKAIYSSEGRRILGVSAVEVFPLLEILESPEDNVEKKLKKIIGDDDDLRDACDRWLKQEAKIADEEEKDLPIVPKEPSGVRFMTLHGSKGLDAKFVFLPCLENEIVPGRYNLEEQRRLIYVGIARAKNAAILSWAWKRIGASSHKAGRGRPIKRSRSVFINEMGLSDVKTQQGIKALKSYSGRWR